MAGYVSEQPSWAQLHRLGQLEAEASEHVHNPHYTVRAERVEPALDTGRLGRAWAAAVARHPVLGSGFDIPGRRWRLPLGTPAASLSECSPDGFRDALTAPFDYAAGPLARLAVAQCGGATLVGIAIDHLVSDGWTLASTWADLAAGYSGAGAGPGGPETGFRDWVAAERQRLAAPRTQEQVRDLERRLRPFGGAIPVLSLPRRAGPRNVTAAIAKEESRFRLGPSDWERTCRAARTLRLSGAGVLLCALHAALHSLTGEPDVGTTLAMANRAKPALRRSAGWFAGKLVVRSDMGRFAGSLADYLPSWRQGFWAALDTGGIPWAYLLSRLNPGDFGGFTAEPFVTFNFQTAQMSSPAATTWHEHGSMTRMNVPTGHREAAMSTFWMQADGGIDVLWQHQPSVIDQAMARKLWLTTESLLRTAGAEET